MNTREAFFSKRERERKKGLGSNKFGFLHTGERLLGRVNSSHGLS